MRYANAAAFRQALEARVQSAVDQFGLPHTRLRKLIVFDRLLSRLLRAEPEGWVLKGAVALVLRWEHQARTTQDLDLGSLAAVEHMGEALARAAALKLEDFFVFTVHPTNRLESLTELTAVRYQVTASLAGRPFEKVLVDIGFSTALALQPEIIPGTSLLEFAGFSRLDIPTIAIEEHIAEKIHAYVGTYASGTSTRVKDLVDLLLIAQLSTPQADRLTQALQVVFTDRGVKAPRNLPPPPNHWAERYSYLVEELDIDILRGNDPLSESYALVAMFLQPVLGGVLAPGSRWNPATQRWES